MSEFLQEYLPFVSIYLVFAFYHSLCAHEVFKNWLTKITSSFFVEYYWRLVYVVLSFIIYYYGIHNLFPEKTVPIAKRIIFTYPQEFYDMRICLKTFGYIVFSFSCVQLNYFEFWGFKQFWQGTRLLLKKNSESVAMQLSGVNRFEAKGVYKIVRHPMMMGVFFIMLFLKQSIDVNRSVHVVLFFFYMVIGGYYEEKRLIKNLGEPYRAYMKKVGAFFPKTAQFLDGLKWLQRRIHVVNIKP